MKRWLFQLAVTTSFLLVISVVILWTMSYARFDNVGMQTALRGNRESGGTVESSIGVIRCTVWTRQYLKPLPGPHNGSFSYAQVPYMVGSWGSRVGATKMWGFSFTRIEGNANGVAGSDGTPRNDVPQTVWLIAFPHWALVVVTGILPLVWLMNHRRAARRRIAAGLCPICGYDLRASSGRCPECGEPIHPAALKPAG
jgi:hypothetical protein